MIIANPRELHGENICGTKGFAKLKHCSNSGIVIDKEILPFMKLGLLEKRFFYMSLLSFHSSVHNEMILMRHGLG